MVDAVATYGDAGAIGVFFLRENCSDHSGEDDLFASIVGDVFVIYDKEGIRAFNALAFYVWSCSYALSEVSHLVVEGLVPYVGAFRVFARLAVLQKLAGVLI